MRNSIEFCNQNTSANKKKKKRSPFVKSLIELVTSVKRVQFNYSENTMVWDESFQLNTNTTLQLSEKWKLSYRVGFDLIKQTMGWQSFTFTRNLHCWEFNFKWIPGKSYFLHIYVKKPELRDIKLESRSKNNNPY